ncbi:hypothetical protein COBT_002418 [Conglomerata obtusa]
MIHKTNYIKKFKSSRKLPICHLSDINATRIQDHAQIAYNTGMEEIETHELHFKAALADQNVIIPTPSFELNIKQTARLKLQKPKELIKHTQDVTNHYVLSDEDFIFINESKISIEEFYDYIDCINEENKFDGNQDLVLTNVIINDKARNYVQDRLLLLYDDDGFNPYVCFRDQNIKTTTKSRKIGAMFIDEFKKIWRKIITQKKLQS